VITGHADDHRDRNDGHSHDPATTVQVESAALHAETVRVTEHYRRQAEEQQERENAETRARRW
jgi:hypothetical protein